MRPASLHCLSWLILIVGVIAATAGFASAQMCCKPELHQESGLHVASFQTPGGTLRVFLPEDMAGGDTISGTVVGAPVTQGPSEVPGELRGYVVEIEGNKPDKDGRAKFVLPAGASQTMLLLRDKAGQEVSQQAVPVRAAGSALAAPYCATHGLSHAGLNTLDEYTQQGLGGFRVPAVAQAGQPLQICGPFDGDLAHTALRVGGQAARALAESPRQAIFQAPAGATGALPIELNQGGRQARGTIQLLSLSLSAPKTTLRRGEQTTLTVTVSGLAGLRESVPLELTNQSRNVVTLEGGDTQMIPVLPVQGQDQFAITRTVTGVQPGTFDIRAQVKIETAPGSSAPAGGSKPAVSMTGPGESSAPAPGSGAAPGPNVATGPGGETPVGKVGKPGDTSTFCAPGSVGMPTGAPKSPPLRPLMCRGTIEMLLTELYPAGELNLWGTFAHNPTEAGESGEKLAAGTCAWPEASLDPGQPSQFLYEFSPATPQEAQRASLIEHCASDPACVFEVCSLPGVAALVLFPAKLRLVFPKF